MEGPLSTQTAASELRVRELDASADGRWDRYVQAHPGGLVFHHSGWLRALGHENGRRPVCLAAEDAAGELLGVLPLMTTRGLPVGSRGIANRRLSSLPRTPVAGPIADDRDVLRSLLTAAVERTPAGAQLQLKLLEPRLDGLVEGLACHPWRLTYVLDLPAHADDLQFGDRRGHAAARRSVNKAIRSGVRLREATSGRDVRAWYRLYLGTMRLHAVPARPLRFFEALWDELRPKGAMRLLLAEREGQVLAGSVLLMLGSTVFYAFNAVLRSSTSVRPNDLLQWESIRTAIGEGFRRYDLGEVVEGQAGLAQFKRKWGGTPRRMHRYYAPPPAEAPDPGTEASGSWARVGRAAWQRVPLRATALIGDGVYRFL